MRARSLAVKIAFSTILAVLATQSSLSGLNSINSPLQKPKPITICQTGYASFYSYECARNPMANGQPFDPEKRTCASWFYKFGTVLTVKSLDTGRSTQVIVTDRGPNMRFVKEGRIIDLSRRAFEDICDTDKGLTKVQVLVKSKI